MCLPLEVFLFLFSICCFCWHLYGTSLAVIFHLPWFRKMIHIRFHVILMKSTAVDMKCISLCNENHFVGVLQRYSFVCEEHISFYFKITDTLTLVNIINFIFVFCYYWNPNTSRKFDVFVLREKCPYSEIFWPAFSRVTPRIQSKCGKMRTRITPNTDIFYAVLKFGK